MAEFSGQKGLNQIPGQLRAFDPSAQAQQVEVVILNPLPGRKMVFDQAGADVFDLVRANILLRSLRQPGLFRKCAMCQMRSWSRVFARDSGFECAGAGE